MAFLDATFARYAMKKLLGLAHTTNAKDPGNEAEAVRNFIPASHIPTYNITTTAGAVASTILDCTNATAGLSTSRLSLDLDASSSGDAYFVEVPASHDLLNYTNPITGVAYVVGDRVSNIITKKFGSSWRPVLYDNVTEVPPAASNDWFLDETGVVTAETDLSLGSTGKLACYVYVGPTAATAFPTAAFTTIACDIGTNPVADSTSDTLTITAGANILITGNSGTDTVTIATTGVATTSFATIACPSGSNPVADSNNDTLNLAAGSGITITGDSATDTVTIASTAANLSFSTIACSSGTNPSADSATDTLTLTGGTGITVTGDSSTDTITIAATGGGGGNSFETINCPSGTDPVADSSTDTLNLAAGSNISITGDSATDTVTFAVTGLPTAAFTTIDCSSGTDPVADSASDTLTLTGGTGITVTGDSTTDTVTIACTVTAPNCFATIDCPSGTDPVADSTSDTLTLAAGANMSITGNSGTDTVTFAVTGLPTVAFTTIDCPSGTDPVADSTSDTLTLTAGANMSITGDSATDAVTFAVTGLPTVAFTTIACTSGTNPVADTASDTLTLTAGTGITITGDSATDTVTIAATGGGGGTPGGSDTQVQFNDGGAFGGDSGLVFDKTTNILSQLGPTRQANGSAASPSYSFTSSTGYGMWTDGTDLNWSIAGVEALNLDVNGNLLIIDLLGSASTPNYSFIADPNTGMFRGGADTLAFSTGGTQRAQLDSTGLTIPNQFVSSLAIGTAPLAVTSTTLCTNLNADLLDGQHASAFATAGTYTNTVTAADTTLTISPNSGAVQAAINLSSSNVWDATQTIGNIGGSDINTSLTVGAKHGTDTIVQGLRHRAGRSGGNAAAGFGYRELWQLENGAGSQHDAAKSDLVWIDPADTTEDAQWSFYTISAGAFVEYLRLSSVQCIFGVPGDIQLGDGTVRDMYPQTTECMNLGTVSSRFLNCRLGGDLDLDEGSNVLVGTTTGTKIGTSTSSKIGFFNSTPVVQPSSTTDLRQALIDLGLYATGGATPLNLNGGNATVNAITINADSTIADGVDFALGTGTGTKFGTGTTQKIGFFNATPQPQVGSVGDIKDMLCNFGFMVNSGASPLNLDGGALTCGAANITGLTTISDAQNIAFNTTTGTKIGTATTQKIGFWGKTPVVRPSAYTITNGTTDRSYDANSTTIDELADALSTLIADLQSIGLIG